MVGIKEVEELVDYLSYIRFPFILLMKYYQTLTFISLSCNNNNCKYQIYVVYIFPSNI